MLGLMMMNTFDDDEQEIPEKTAEQHLTFIEVP